MSTFKDKVTKLQEKSSVLEAGVADAKTKRLLYDITAEEPLDISLPKIQSAIPDYPSEWFAARSPDANYRKPMIKLTTDKSINEQNWSLYVKALLKKTLLSADEQEVALRIGLTYLREPTQNEFDSFGVKIQKEQTIAPMELCDLKEKKEASLNVPTETDYLDDDAKRDALKRLLLRVCLPNRYAGLNPKAPAELINKYLSTANSLLIQMGKENGEYTFPPTLTTWKTEGTAWQLLDGMVSGTAILDLWIKLTKTAKSNYSGVMFATLSSYGQGATAISTLLDFTTFYKVSITDFSKFFFPNDIYNDFKRIFKQKNEIGQTFTYTYYCVPLKMVTTTPYSAAANPYLFTFIHAIELANKKERSFNATCKSITYLESNLQLAMILAFRFKRNSEDGYHLIDSKEELEKVMSVYKELSAMEEALKEEDSNPLKNKDEQEPEEIDATKLTLKEQNKASKATRKDLVGEEINTMDALTIYKNFYGIWKRKAPTVCKKEYYIRVESWREKQARPDTVGYFLIEHLKQRSKKKAEKNSNK